MNLESYGVNMIPEEYEEQVDIAMNIYNKLAASKQNITKITLAKIFVLGFLHGRQQTLKDIGIFDDMDDDDKIYDFYEKNVRTNND